MVEELGNAVAFASAPLHIGPPGQKHSHSGTDPSIHTRRASDGASQIQTKGNAKQVDPSNQVLESFYVVPTINRPGRLARGNSAPPPQEGSSSSSRPASAQNKTHEELVAENTTLKETLDHLSKRLDWITKERMKEKETLRDSVTIFARDVKRQAERLGQSTVNFADTRRQMPPSFPMTALPTFVNSTGTSTAQQTEELQKKVSYLQEELRLSRAECEKQSANAQRYKARYDDLRKAILEKRRAKEMALAAAAAGETTMEAGASSTADKASGEDHGRDVQDQKSRKFSVPSTHQNVQAIPTT